MLGAGCRVGYGVGEETAERLISERDAGSSGLGGEGVGDSCDIGDARTSCDAVGHDADEEGVGVCNTNGSCWTRR